jgi:hypothetical protein
MIKDTSIKCTNIYLKMCVVNKHISSSEETPSCGGPYRGLSDPLIKEKSSLGLGDRLREGKG